MRGGMMLAAVAAWAWTSSAAAFDGPGRFTKHKPDGDIERVVHSARATIRPLYELRGVLFQLRVELLSQLAGEEDRARLAPWLKMDAANAGWAALQLDRMRAEADDKKRSKIVIETARFIASRVNDKAAKRNLRDLVAFEALRPGTVPPADEALVLSYADRADSRRNLVRLVNRVPKILQSFEKVPKRTVDAAHQIRRSIAATVKNAKGAAKGKKKEAGKTLANAIDALVGLPAVIEDIQAVPDLVSGMTEEVRVLVTGLGDLQSAIAGRLPAGEAFDLAGHLRSLDGRIPAAASFDELAEALVAASEKLEGE